MPRCTRPDLVRAVRQEVEVDSCASCLGVWFDCGEVEKVFDRLSTVDLDDVPERWEPLQRELAPSLFADLVDLVDLDRT